MIDLVRIHYKDKKILEEQVLKVRDNFKVISNFEYHDSNIIYPIIKKILNIEIRITKHYGYAFGSLHKYYNGGLQNYNLFSYSNLINTIDNLSKVIKDFEKMPITQLEIGFNLLVNKNPSEIINNNLYFHIVKNYNHDNEFNGKGKLYQYDYSQYLIKVYDKSKMFNLNENILRFEIKMTNRKLIEKFGVKNLTDLKDKTILRKLFLLVLKRFDEMCIIDDFDKHNLNDENLNLLRKYTNENFWKIELKNKSRTTRINHRKRFHCLLNNLNLLNTKNEIRKELNKSYLLIINN